LDAKTELLEIVVLRTVVDQRNHFDGLRMMADHALHEFHVRRRVLDLRQVGRLLGIDRLRVLTWRARLQDARSRRGTAACGLARGDANS
jgi:hypothetical protein